MLATEFTDTLCVKDKDQIDQYLTLKYWSPPPPPFMVCVIHFYEKKIICIRCIVRDFSHFVT